MSSPVRGPARRGVRHLVPVALLALAGGCTLVKPVAGVVTGAAIGLAAVGQGGGTGDARAALCVVAGFGAVGAVSGLVTGVLSDIHWLTGRSQDPTRNWFDPFCTNLDELSRGFGG